MPPLPPEFTGRDEHLRDLVAALGPSPDGAFSVVISAVAGMGGIGKTTLAIAAAQTWLARGWFGHCLWLDLHGYSHDAEARDAHWALGEILRALDTEPHDIPPEAEERAAKYRQTLEHRAARGERPLLVVADNAAPEARVELLRPPGGSHRLLVTSRERPDLTGARFIGLDVLDETEAVELLAAALKDARPVLATPQDRTRLQPLARACAGLPLALRIAAGRLFHETLLTPEELTTELADTARRLDRLSPTAGSHSLRAVFETSLRRLPDHLHELLLRLTLNPGPDISTHAAAVLAEAETATTRAHLRELAARHLLGHSPGEGPGRDRWAMHDLLADYVRERRGARAAEGSEAEEQHNAARERLLGYYRRTADAADDHLRALPGQEVPDTFADTADALAWLDAERATLLAAVPAARDCGDSETAISLPLALSVYLGRRWLFEARITGVTIARDAAQEVGDRHGEARAWHELGNTLDGLRRFEEAFTAYQTACILYQETGDRPKETLARNDLNSIRLDMSLRKEAIHAYQQDLIKWQEVGNRHSEAMTWHELGIVYFDMGKDEEAIAALRRAVALYDESGDKHGSATAQDALAIAQNCLAAIRRLIPGTDD
jgi:tetratricopeptide (TPR) repeat protein